MCIIAFYWCDVMFVCINSPLLNTSLLAIVRVHSAQTFYTIIGAINCCFITGRSGAILIISTLSRNCAKTWSVDAMRERRRKWRISFIFYRSFCNNNKYAEEWQHRHAESNNSTPFDLKRILIEGPLALPKELRSKPKYPNRFVLSLF